ncbi:MAG: GntR family transcriptional regulator [bacterium]
MVTDILQIEVEEVKLLRDRIAGKIRDAIVLGKIKPGERLMEPEVAKMLGVSRTPLREAFLQLESEGFMVVTPRKGAVVSELSAKDAEDTYIIKSSMEALAAKITVGNADKKLIDDLTAINVKLENVTKSKKHDYKLFLELNSKFHNVLCEASNNEKLIKYISLLRKQTLRYNFIYLSLLSHFEQSVEEHKSIIEAIQYRDVIAVEILVQNHSNAAKEAICAFMKQNLVN